MRKREWFSSALKEKLKTERMYHWTLLKLTEQMAAGDALLSQCGLHSRNGGGENVRLLKHLRGMWPIQWAEHSTVVELHPLIQFNYRELVPARLGAPVFVLQSQTEAVDTSSSEITRSSPAFPFHMSQHISVFSARFQCWCLVEFGQLQWANRTFLL